jgi:hypothetical protein
MVRGRPFGDYSVTTLAARFFRPTWYPYVHEDYQVSKSNSVIESCS